MVFNWLWGEFWSRQGCCQPQGGWPFVGWKPTLWGSRSSVRIEPGELDKDGSEGQADHERVHHHH